MSFFIERPSGWSEVSQQQTKSALRVASVRARPSNANQEAVVGLHSLRPIVRQGHPAAAVHLELGAPGVGRADLEALWVLLAGRRERGLSAE
jgi:hypothetical protein